MLIALVFLAGAANADEHRPSSSQSPPAAGPADLEQGTVVVKFRSVGKARSVQDRLGRQYGFAVRDEIAGIKAKRISVPAGQEAKLSAELKKNPLVEYAEPNYVYTASQIPPQDPLYASDQWNLEMIGAPAAWGVTTGNPENIIAIVDTGVDGGHHELDGKLVAGYNTVSENAITQDGHGHGTHVAGIAAAETNNGEGIAGINWGASIMPVKVLDDDGRGNEDDISEGIVWAADHGAQVINLSLGGPYFSGAMMDAVAYAHSRNVLVVAAAGNSGQGSNYLAYPASYPYVIAVGATTSADARANFSTYNASVDVSAPGEWITSSTITSRDPSGYISWRGTSMASPHVAGLASLLLSADNTLNTAQLTKILEESVVDHGGLGRDDEYGYGRIDADVAVHRADQFVWYEDVTAPQVNQVLPAGNIPVNASTIDVTFSDTGITNGIDPESTQVLLDGYWLTGCTTTQASISCPFSELDLGPHAISGRVVDNSGNTTPISGAFVVEDTSAPVVTKIRPANTIISSSGDVTVNYTDWFPATPTSFINTGSLVVSVDGNVLTGCSVATQTEVTCPFSGLADGTHVIDASVSDMAGNTGTGSRSFELDMTGVGIGNVRPFEETLPQAATIRADYLDFAGSEIDLGTVRVELDGITLASCVVEQATVSCGVAGLAPGEHSVLVSASDYLGNSDSTGSTFTVDDNSIGLTISASAGGKHCELVGTWDAPTNTCTLNTNIHLLNATNGFSIMSDGITLDGAGHLLVGMGGNTTGVSALMRHNITIKNMQIRGFEYGISSIGSSHSVIAGNSLSSNTYGLYISPPFANPDISVYHNGFDNNITDAHVSGDYQIDFGIGLPGGGNWWSNYDSPEEGCNDNNGDGFCDAGHAYTGGSDSLPWTRQGAWSGDPVPDTTAPVITATSPAVTIFTSSTDVSASFGDVGGSGINSASAQLALDGTTLTGCVATSGNITCPASGLANGTHTISASVADNAGNTGSGTGAFDVNADGVTIIDITPQGTVTTPAATIRSNYYAPSGINTGTVQVKLDGTVLSSCDAGASSVTCGAAALANGTHTIEVNASDYAGHSDTSTGSFTVSFSSSNRVIAIDASANGRQCTSVGTWDAATKTCTLVTDIQLMSQKNGIDIQANGITLEGAGHTLTGAGGFTTGVQLVVRSGINIRNLEVGSFNNGIYAVASTNLVITGNTVKNNPVYGLFLSPQSPAPNISVYRNNFENNGTQAYVSGSYSIAFGSALPVGGNWWSNFDTPEEGCSDANSDGICDATYTFTGGNDAFAWTSRNRWSAP